MCRWSQKCCVLSASICLLMTGAIKIFIIIPLIIGAIIMLRTGIIYNRALTPYNSICQMNIIIYNLASLSWIYFEPPYARRERCSAAKVFQVVSFQKNFLRQQLVANKVSRWNLMCYHFQFDDPDMVKGFRYKLYSTATEADQLKKEEKVKFPLSCPTTQNVKNPPKAWFGIPKHVST